MKYNYYLLQKFSCKLGHLLWFVFKFLYNVCNGQNQENLQSHCINISLFLYVFKSIKLMRTVKKIIFLWNEMSTQCRSKITKRQPVVCRRRC